MPQMVKERVKLNYTPWKIEAQSSAAANIKFFTDL